MTKGKTIAAAYPYSVYQITLPGRIKRVWVIVKEETEEIVRGSFDDEYEARRVCKALNA